jgi:hypothetical protein
MFLVRWEQKQVALGGDDVDDDDTCCFEAKHGDGVVALGMHYTTQPSGCSVAIISLYMKEYQLMLEACIYLQYINMPDYPMETTIPRKVAIFFNNPTHVQQKPVKKKMCLVVDYA